ncbi:hypothetical protein SBV1_690008 [Verrucomicrobia bacterium]|nr:hypothetical protein SBV1_690008 [Verrucomicrobiota bacterium]
MSLVESPYWHLTTNDLGSKANSLTGSPNEDPNKDLTWGADGVLLYRSVVIGSHLCLEYYDQIMPG